MCGLYRIRSGFPFGILTLPQQRRAKAGDFPLSDELPFREQRFLYDRDNAHISLNIYLRTERFGETL
jgi:hypothetical protein